MSATTPATAQENEASEEYGTAPLCGVELRVKPVTAWRPSYLRYLREGDYDGWAAGALHEDDVQTFIDLDATFEEINEFTASAMTSAGETPGKSGARSASSKTTRKR
ncbi:hypothetical protein OTB20_08365 [Streptomyces sp. H27-H1]|uniref:hypothetical protein n=1 Tax=Streptomyces sp. H27-H1 TaxID=2996461 RepID=UPI002271F5A0|nr:hypothetical protein [Streptomyces sp. H27-H1]MCY0926218.1 hypothetical protein [Streptomyces sp. H27-H1]